jgi:hypothetical protein
MPSSAAAGGWTTMNLPSFVVQPAVLNDIAAASPDEAWAVGTEALSAVERPLLLHWNGRRWIKDAIPGRPIAGQVDLVSAVAPRTAWALGYSTSGAALILRWAGRGWVKVQAPGILRNQVIYSIAAGTGGSAWLYGYSGSRGNLLEHWTGRRWHEIRVPSRLSGAATNMIAAGPRGVWLSDDTNEGVYVLAHYAAGKWTSIAPPPSGGLSIVTGFLPVSTRSVWAAGYLCTAAQPEAGCTASRAEIAHWNGSAWSTRTHLGPIAETTSVSPGRTGRPLWAGVMATGPREPLLYEHFNGKTWSLVAASRRERGVSTMTIVAAVPGSSATWAITERETTASAPGAATIQYNSGR